MVRVRHWLWFVFAVLLVSPARAQIGGGGLGGNGLGEFRNASPVKSHPWGQFLGPTRNGVSIELGLIDSFPAGGPSVVWRAKGGVGMAGLVVDGDRVLTLAERNDKQALIAWEAESGKELWHVALAPAYKNQMGNGSGRATPVLFGGCAFVFTGEGVLSAVNLKNQFIEWSVNAVKELRGKIADYGMASSPLILEPQKLVVVTVGAPNATLAAFDVRTGKLAWTAGEDPAGYSSPALLEIGGKSQIVAFTGASALGVDPQGGALLWRHEYVTDFDCNIATPIAFDGQVFISSGENHGCALVRVMPGGDQLITSEVWSSQGPKSVLRNEWQTSILVGDVLYGFDNVGSAGPVTHLACINVATGKKLWEKQRFGKGNLLLADGKLFIVTINGELVTVSASPEKYQELGRAMVCGFTRTAPALANGLLYLRDNDEIVCLNVRKSAP